MRFARDRLNDDLLHLHGALRTVMSSIDNLGTPNYCLRAAPHNHRCSEAEEVPSSGHLAVGIV